MLDTCSLRNNLDALSEHAATRKMSEHERKPADAISDTDRVEARDVVGGSEEAIVEVIDSPVGGQLASIRCR
jgi:hypothetical protein